MKQLLAVLIGLFPALICAESDAQKFWPQWRGPAGTGAALHGDPPVEWSADKNIRWKAELPGTGFATPIVWGDRVFVSVATITGQPASIREQGQRGRI